MKVDIKKLPKSEAELTVEVSNYELKPFLTNAAARMSKGMKISGFRPGKAPYDIVKKQVGEAQIYQEAVEDVVKKTFPKAVLDHKLKTVGQPKIEIEKLAPGNPLVYKAKVALLPDITLGDYKNVKAKKEEVKLEKKEIDEALKKLQQMRGKEISVDRAAKKGDKVEVDFDVYVDKVPIEGGSSKKHPLVIGQNSFIPGFEENLIGLTKNKVKEFKLRFPKDYHKKDLAGKEAEFKVKMQAVYKIELPKLNDEFAKTLGKFKNFAELQKNIEENLKKEKKAQAERKFESKILKDIIKNSKFAEIPDLLINSELDKMLKEMEQNIARQGLKFDDYLKSIKKSKEDLKKELKPQAEQRIKTALVMQHIAQKENIEASDKEVEEEIKKAKEQYKDNQEVVKQLESPEYKMYLKNFLTSKKTMEFLKNLAK